MTYNPLTAFYDIKILRGSLIDAARRDRPVPYKIYLPEASDLPGPRPLVIWSHGLGGSRDGAGFISRHLAARGFITLHVQHFGTDSTLWEGKAGHPWDVIRAAKIPRRAVLQRYKDIPYIIDALPHLTTLHPELLGRIDMGRMGLSGHSLGALTTQMLAGQYGMRTGSTRFYDLHHPAFRAGILYSPVPLYRHPSKARDAYRGIRIPLFHMTGTADHSPVGGFQQDMRADMFTHAGHDDQLLLVFQDGDHMVYSGSRGQLDENPLRAAHETAIIAGTTAYWDTYLRDDTAARDWLLGDGFRAYLQPGDVLKIRGDT